MSLKLRLERIPDVFFGTGSVYVHLDRGDDLHLERCDVRVCDNSRILHEVADVYRGYLRAPMVADASYDGCRAFG